MKNLKKIPKFKSKLEERRFWESHDSSDYLDWSKGEKVKFSNLKPSKKYGALSFLKIGTI